MRSKLYRGGGATIRLFKKYYPSYVSHDDHFDAMVKAYLRPDMRVLDAGCGDGTISKYEYKKHTKIIIGVDLHEDLVRNDNVHFAVRGDLEAIPFGRDSFDLILCRYVVEHLEHPERVFREFNRVLRDGGVAIIHDPNVFHYVPLIAWLTPHWLHRGIIRHILSRDSLPKYYRANSRRELTRLMGNAGFELLEVDMFESAPDYLAFSPVLYMLGIIYERFINRFDRLSFLRLSIIASFRRLK